MPEHAHVLIYLMAFHNVQVARIKSLRRGDAEAAAARASALAAAAALAREQERCRRQLRTAAKDCLLAVQVGKGGLWVQLLGWCTNRSGTESPSCPSWGWCWI